jgi:membrane dipeptidase
MRLSRRHFLERTGIAVGGMMCGVPIRGLADDGYAVAVELLHEHPSFDLHCHPGRLHVRGTAAYGGDEGVGKTVAEMRTGQLWAGFFALVADSPILERGLTGITVGRAFEPGEAWDVYRQQLSVLKELLGRLPAAQAIKAQDIGRIHEQGQVTAFIACEGAHCLEGRPERVEQMYNDGVRMLQLVHYAQDVIADLQTEEPVYDGLSAVGKEVVREMNRLGMVIDVAHASYKTVLDTAAISETPLILSHSQLKWGDRRHPRLLDPEHAKAIAATGGVIGMWPSGFNNDTFDDFVVNTMRMIELVGVEHVGLGTDMDSNYRPVFDSYTQLPDWTAALLSRGLSENEASQVVGGNALRVLGQTI